jgi:methyl-accepting chemotaxis protein
MVESLEELAGVATRMQMLALNASIEAAHARKHGAGFSVVAGEVQKLADRSGRISDQISVKVHETEAALGRTAVQVEVIASKDLNEIIRSKQLAETMVKAISHSELQAQQLVARMEEVGREVTDQVARSIQALQFEDMVRQILQRVAAGSERLAAFAARIQTLADAVAEGREAPADLLDQAVRDFAEFSFEGRDTVQASSMDSGDVELF